MWKYIIFLESNYISLLDFEWRVRRFCFVYQSNITFMQKHSTSHVISSLFLYILVTVTLTHFLHIFFILDFNYTEVWNTVFFIICSYKSVDYISIFLLEYIIIIFAFLCSALIVPNMPFMYFCFFCLFWKKKFTKFISWYLGRN